MGIQLNFFCLVTLFFFSVLSVNFFPWENNYRFFFINVLTIFTWIERRISEMARERWRRERTEERSLIVVTNKIDCNEMKFLLLLIEIIWHWHDKVIRIYINTIIIVCGLHLIAEINCYMTLHHFCSLANSVEQASIFQRDFGTEKLNIWISKYAQLKLLASIHK